MTKTLTVVGIPMDPGQSRRGVDMGPSSATARSGPASALTAQTLFSATRVARAQSNEGGGTAPPGSGR